MLDTDTDDVALLKKFMQCIDADDIIFKPYNCTQDGTYYTIKCINETTNTTMFVEPLINDPLTWKFPAKSIYSLMWDSYENLAKMFKLAIDDVIKHQRSGFAIYRKNAIHSSFDIEFSSIEELTVQLDLLSSIS